MLAAAIAFALPPVALADASYDALKKQVEVLQKQLEAVQQSLQHYEQRSASKAEVEALKHDVAQAAADSSEWKNADSVVHLAGYGDMSYSDRQGNNTNGSFSAVRFNPIFHYQYKDLVMLEAELEIEAENNGGTSTNLEYMTVDFFANDYATLVAGKFLSPIGQFRQNLHPSWINKLPTAPSGFGHDQAAPVSETGLQARGGFPIASQPMYINYAIFAGNGPVLEIVGGEIEAVGAEGRTSNDDDRLVWGGRVGFLPVPALEVGLSAATGEIAGDAEPSARRDYDVYGADMAYQWRNLGLRSEYVKQKVGSTASSVAPQSAQWEAWYAQAAYRFLPTKWELVARYSDYDSFVDADDQKQWAFGANYLFAPNAQAKVAYNFNDNSTGSVADKNSLQLQLSYGF